MSSTTSITLSIANKMVDAALAEGAKRTFAPLAVVVLDSGAHILCLKRDERASLGRADLAISKAAGCLAMGFNGRDMARFAEQASTFFLAANGVLPHGVLPVAGGVLIRGAGGSLIGAIGVSGDWPDNDEICAVAAILAAGLVPDAGMPPA